MLLRCALHFTHPPPRKKKEIQFIFTHFHFTHHSTFHAAKRPFLRQLLHFFREKTPLAEFFREHENTSKMCCWGVHYTFHSHPKPKKKSCPKAGQGKKMTEICLQLKSRKLWMRTSTKTQGVHVRHFFSHPYLTRWPFQVKCAPVNIRNMCVSFPTSFPKSLQHHSQKVSKVFQKFSTVSKSFPRFRFHGFL